MKSSSTKPTTVAAYIAQAPKISQARLRAMRSAIKSVVPNATESLKWGMPAFSGKRMLVAYAAFNHHIGFYPTPSPIKAFAKELSKYKTARGSIQFPYALPLPLSLVKKITALRAKESLKRDALWKSSSIAKKKVTKKSAAKKTAKKKTVKKK